MTNSRCDNVAFESLSNGTWTAVDASSCSITEFQFGSCAKTHLASNFSNDFAQVFVGVLFDEGMACRDSLRLQVVLEEGIERSNTNFGSSCFEPDYCYETPTPAPTFSLPPPPLDNGICEFDQDYKPYSGWTRYRPATGISTYQPLELPCPVVNDTVVIWFDVVLPTDGGLEDSTTYTKVSLAVATGESTNLTDGITLHSCRCGTPLCRSTLHRRCVRHIRLFLDECVVSI